MCIVGKLVGGGSVAVAIGISDRWQVTGDRYMTFGSCWSTLVWPLTIKTDMNYNKIYAKPYSLEIIIKYHAVSQRLKK